MTVGPVDVSKDPKNISTKALSLDNKVNNVTSHKIGKPRKFHPSQYHHETKHSKMDDKKPTCCNAADTTGGALTHLADGNNSSDEYPLSKSSSEAVKLDESSQEALDHRGLKMIKMKEDGSCLFRAVAQQLYGDQEKHAIVRESCLLYIEEHWEFFKDFVTEDKKSYITRKRSPFCHGNHVEIAAMSYLYNTRIEIYTDGKNPINTFDSPSRFDLQRPPIRLAYQNNNHYDAIVDCANPLSSYAIGPSDSAPLQKKSNLAKNFEEELIEDCYIRTQLREADWEEAENQILRKVQEDSYVEWQRLHFLKGGAHKACSKSSSPNKITTSSDNPKSSPKKYS